MKKATMKFFTAALATATIVAPISATAATTVEQGVYFEATGEFFTTDELANLSIGKIAELFSKNKQEQVYIYLAGVGTATLKQANDTTFISAANVNGHTNAPENIIPNKSYIGLGNKTIVIEGNDSVGQVPETEFKVLSIF